MKKVFGIISYIPNNEQRKIRWDRAEACLKKLSAFWPTVDILIIAQNWKEDCKIPDIIKNKVILYKFDALGILGARRKLREKFLESDYDFMITLDDDAIIHSDDAGKSYMAQIDAKPNDIGIFRDTSEGCQLMLLAAPKWLYEKQNYELDPQLDEGYEDEFFLEALKVRWPNSYYLFNRTHIGEYSFDEGKREIKVQSTWAATTKHDWKKLRDGTDEALRKVYAENGLIWTGHKKVQRERQYKEGIYISKDPWMPWL